MCGTWSLKTPIFGWSKPSLLIQTRQGKSLNAMLKTSLLISFKDKVSAPLKGLRKQAKLLRTRFDSLKTSLSGVGKQSAILGGLAGAATFGLFRLADGAARQGDELAKTAKMLGLNVVELQQWQFAAERAGISKQNLNTSIQRFTRRTDEARRGTGEALAALKYLNVALTDGNGNMRSQTDLLDEIADKFKTVKGDAERLAIATKLFDTEGAKMVNLLAEGSAGMQALRKEALALGVYTEDSARASEHYTDVMANFKQLIHGLKGAIGSALLPELSEFIKLQTDLIKTSKGEYLKQSIATIKEFARIMWSLIQTVHGVVVALGGLKAIATALGAVFALKLILNLVSLGAALYQIGAVVIPFLIGMMKALSIAFAANPIGLIVTLIIGAVALIYLHWTPIKRFFVKLWKDISDPFKKGFVHGVVSYLKNFSPVALIAKGLNQLVQYLTGFSLAELGTQLVDSLKSGMMQGMLWLHRAMTQKVQDLINLVPKGLRGRLGLDSVNESLDAVLDLNQSLARRTEVGGDLRIRIDAEGRPKVQQLRKRGNMDIEVQTGRIMAGAS